MPETSPADIARAWRGQVPDVTEEEIRALIAIGLAGTKAQLAVRVLRAARRDMRLGCGDPVGPDGGG